DDPSVPPAVGRDGLEAVAGPAVDFVLPAQRVLLVLELLHPEVLVVEVGAEEALPAHVGGDLADAPNEREVDARPIDAGLRVLDRDRQPAQLERRLEHESPSRRGAGQPVELAGPADAFPLGVRDHQLDRGPHVVTGLARGAHAGEDVVYIHRPRWPPDEEEKECEAASCRSHGRFGYQLPGRRRKRTVWEAAIPLLPNHENEPRSSPPVRGRPAGPPFAHARVAKPCSSTSSSRSTSVGRTSAHSPPPASWDSRAARA